MKKCSCCKVEKSFEEFHKNNKRKDGVVSYCKSCCKEYYITNTLNYKERYEENKEKLLEYQSIYSKNNRSQRRCIDAKRRASKLNATPKWLTDEDKMSIQLIYDASIWMTQVFEEEFHVDHIVPLQGENVCGLHVPWNLQVIPAKENLSKSNKLYQN